MVMTSNGDDCEKRQGMTTIIVISRDKVVKIMKKLSCEMWSGVFYVHVQDSGVFFLLSPSFLF